MALYFTVVFIITTIAFSLVLIPIILLSYEYILKATKNFIFFYIKILQLFTKINFGSFYKYVFLLGYLHKISSWFILVHLIEEVILHLIIYYYGWYKPGFLKIKNKIKKYISTYL